jgi:hypothetical protein
MTKIGLKVGSQRTPIGNQITERKDFFLGDAAADEEGWRLWGDEGHTLGALTSGSGTTSSR